MIEAAWIDTALAGARPKAVGALLRYFRDLDLAEEAFQEACLRALRTWPEKGPPRDPAAWLIFVGRNTGVDALRRRQKQVPLPEEERLSDLSDREGALVESIDSADYRDDILRLLFICCHPDLKPTDQVALALRVVSGLSVHQIARAFLVAEKAMEQRITRAKAKIGAGSAAFETPDALARIDRLGAVGAMVYLVFNEGYSTSVDDDEARGALAEEAIRLGRLLLRMFPANPEIMGLLALMLLQHSRHPARFNKDNEIVLLEDQNRKLWLQPLITEGLALIDKAMRHQTPGIYQIQAAIAGLHARAKNAEDTDWVEIDLLYGIIERMNPSPVVTLNRAVATSKVKGPQAALDMIEPLCDRLDNYFHYHGARGALLKQLGRMRDAHAALSRAIALAGSVAEAAHIRAHLDALERETARQAG